MRLLLWHGWLLEGSETLGNAVRVSRDGAVHFVCMDWRHIRELIEAGRAIYSEMLNLAVWVKSNAGQGSFYRSQHEMIGIFRAGEAKHLNNVELGRHGRSRSNVWHYAGVNTFRAGRMDELAVHPTVKPTGMVMDALKDCTRRGDIVLDTFAGAGTTILAAERVGRRAYSLELEPKYVDVAIRRWQAFTRRDAVHAATGQTFEDVAGGREDAQPAPSAPKCARARRRAAAPIAASQSPLLSKADTGKRVVTRLNQQNLPIGDILGSAGQGSELERTA